MSIRKNILIILMVTQGLLTVGCAISLVLYINEQRNRVFNAEMRRRVSTLMAMVQIDDADPALLEFSPQAESLFPNDLFQIETSKGMILGSSPHSLSIANRNTPADANGFTVSADGSKYRGRFFQAIPVIDEDAQKLGIAAPRIDIVYARPAAGFDATTRLVATIAVLGSLFWIISSCLIAWFSVTRGMIPLGELAAGASGITERNWTLALSPRVRQVAELRPLAQALEGLVERLSAAFERERTFVSDAAHELKTAVAIQKSTLQVAFQGRENAMDYRNGLGRALEDVDRLNMLVHRMLSLASIESSDRYKADVLVTLEETVLAACDQLRPDALAHEIDLNIQISTPCFIASEEGLLETLWVALIENAIRYSPANSTITVSSVVQGDSCKVSVADEGVGIAPECVPHLFERFYRADQSRARDTGGFGLGLAIAKAIVEQHQGRIEVQSELGRGTTVQVTLPRAKERIQA